MTDDAKIKTIEYTEPSPVPEVDWFWRRAYSYVVSAALMAHIGWLTYRIKDESLLAESSRLSQFILVVVLLLYLAGASAEAIGRIIASVRTSRKETVVTAPPPAKLTETTVETPPSTLPDKPGWSR